MARKNALDDKLHWYKDAVIYELHIKAFCDSNGDGIGDFEGLLQKLDYLQNLGITAIWLLPFYPSPLKDDGYDIADYYSINPTYGDIKQFKKLLTEAHKRNLKVITELVINHTSDQHPWFQRARLAPKGSPERDYYVWSDDPNKYDEVRIIFQDFEASNWTWDPVAQQYYWHRFFHHQPDLNYDNPLVQQEVFNILDYWCKMGVDGFRLDAVPYLFEREGTNCENLPETHEFLKSLRKHVDENFPGTLLLAEANMWPEDSASYFGKGDECHMNYHFPVMPRMYMSLQMEDRYPITDIFDQTPAIPETCQWAIFLRNHDELTLEMVTDEERDYMYKVYVRDPKARINLGIRHRLAPLMDNNRKKIELLNYLLFSLPGTPVLYYGDEIGMGDNFYLGDRDGVRTPMQWSADKNAGFSKANPQSLYLPVILDPAYHYEFTNVEMQSRSTSSLLWWTKRLIHLRKQYRSLSRGDLKFINTENSKILAFTRTYENETMLIIVNLSRHVQPVELDLEGHAGSQPVEVFSRNKLPVIKDTPYFLTLTGHDCLWFLLKHTEAEKFEHNSLPSLQLTKWKDIASREIRQELESYILPEYLMKMRWFGGKSRDIQDIEIINTLNIPLETNNAYLLLIQVNYQSGLPETYQMAISFGDKEFEGKVKTSCPQSILARAVIDGKEGVIYDAVYGHEFPMDIYERLVTNDDIVNGSTLKFTGSKIIKKFHKENSTPRAKILSAEQSNTSITFDNKLFLKIYRKVDFAINPDLEITHFLTENADFKYIPRYAGAVIWKSGDKSMVIGMMQEMIESSSDAWVYMLEQVSNYNERILTKGITNDPLKEIKGDLTSPLTYNQSPQLVKDLIEATAADRAALLGKRTAEMHIALASNNEIRDFKPEYFSLHYQRSLFSSFQTLVRSTFQNQSRNLKKLPDDIRPEAEYILGLKDDILTQLKRIYSRKIDAAKIRIHGDYHLGQVLFTGKDFVILDFEGEPARTYSERRLKRSPLRDVTGMIRSFHYAAYAGILLNEQLNKEDKAKLLQYAELWFHYMSGFFMHSYLETANGKGFIPEDLEDVNLLLETYLLEKAIYELNYELNNRPDWVLIPLNGIRSIMEKATKSK